MSEQVDYYVLLGVDRKASSSVIKAAFKKQALQYHPDVYKGEDAAERMRLILEAYQTLNNPSSRQQYDARLKGYKGPSGSGRVTTSAHGRGQTSVSPGARRDRQRYYDFPKFSAGQSVVVDLIDVEYILTPEDADRLVQEGLLRGKLGETSAHVYYCHRCHHHWPVNTADEVLPRFCPQCHAGDWVEYLLMRCVHCGAVFESEQIRNEVGFYNYGHKRGDKLTPPYELFPLCPYCGMAHWSPGEEKRVALLRRVAAHRAFIQRLIWISIAIVLFVFVCFMVLHAAH
jgi:hypothetical protein